MTQHDTDTVTKPNQAPQAATKPITGTSLAEMLPQAPETPEAPERGPAPATTRPALKWNYLGALIVGVLMLVAALIAARSTPAAPADLDSAPSRLGAESAAAPADADSAPDAAPPISAAPTPTPAATLVRSLVAYAAPNGSILGALDAGVHYTAAARYSTDWTQISTAESGLVWVLQADVQVLNHAALPDLMPLPTPTMVVVPRSMPTALPHIDVNAVQPTVCVQSSRAMGCGMTTAEAEANLEYLEQSAQDQRQGVLEATATATTALEVYQREQDQRPMHGVVR